MKLRPPDQQINIRSVFSDELQNVSGYINPGSPKTIFVFSVKTIVLVGIYNQQFKGTILLMVFDFQGIKEKHVVLYLWF